MKTKTVEKSSEKDLINKGLRISGKRAYTKTLENGVPVTVLKDNKICRIKPNGETTVLAQIEVGIRRKISSTTIRLK